MTLNGVIALILRFFSPNVIAQLANYITVVEDRPVMSIDIVSLFQSSIFGYNQTTLQRGLSAIEHFVTVYETRTSKIASLFI